MEKIDVTQIPEGLYCYSNPRSEGVEGWIKLVVDPCPYWELRLDKPKQANGYCHYLKCGDWEHKGLGLLWDQVKECGVNTKY